MRQNYHPLVLNRDRNMKSVSSLAALAEVKCATLFMFRHYNLLVSDKRAVQNANTKVCFLSLTSDGDF